MNHIKKCIKTPHTIFTEINIQSNAVCQALNTAPRQLLLSSNEHAS